MAGGPTIDPKQYRDPDHIHGAKKQTRPFEGIPEEIPPPVENLRGILAGMLTLLKANAVEFPYSDLNGPLSERPINIEDDEDQGVVRVSFG